MFFPGCQISGGERKKYCTKGKNAFLQRKSGEILANFKSFEIIQWQNK
jgi:hypothetical protein